LYVLFYVAIHIEWLDLTSMRKRGGEGAEADLQVEG
jgi:hypothetical protein